MTNTLPPISLIICSRDRPELLEESVLSILAGNVVPSELFIMDQSRSSHPHLAMLKDARCEIRYIQTDARGECPARNQALRLARYELLAFTDDDVRVTQDWLETLARGLIAAGIHAIVTGRVLPETQASDGFAPSTITETQPAIYQGRIGRDVLYPMNMAFWRSTLLDVGLFDERLGAGSPFHGAEDNDFCFRLLEAGYQIHYVPEAILYHRAWRPMRDYAKLHWFYGYGQGAFYAKHMQLRDHYMLKRMGQSLSGNLGHSLRRLWHDQNEAKASAAYALGILAGASRWMISQWMRRVE